MEPPTVTVTRITILLAMVDTHHTVMRPLMAVHMLLTMELRPTGLRTPSQSVPGASAPTIRRARLIFRTAVSGFNVRSRPGKHWRQTLEFACSYAVRAA